MVATTFSRTCIAKKLWPCAHDPVRRHIIHTVSRTCTSVRTFALMPQSLVPRVIATKALRSAFPTKIPEQIRWFQTEAEYHPIADRTLDLIVDELDNGLEPLSIDYELTLANGVLTFSLPPHGTWVINKQTPNRQLWVSTMSREES